MTFRALCFLVFALAFGLLAAGCVDSEQPLSARADAKADPRLVGLWRFESEDKSPDILKEAPGRITF